MNLYFRDSEGLRFTKIHLCKKAVAGHQMRLKRTIVSAYDGRMKKSH